MIQKQGHWVLYELKLRDVQQHLVMCKQKKECFVIMIHCIMISNEKSTDYDNPKHRRSWGKPDHASTSAAKPNIYGSKLLLYIWWDQLVVVYYELLKPIKTIARDHYQLQLMCLSQALKKKWPLYKQRHDTVIWQCDNAWLHVGKQVKIY